MGITAAATDSGGQTITFSLTNNASGRFAINSSTGVVTVADGTLLNFETATSHGITIQATDGVNAASANFTIAVANVNPSTPTDADAAANSVLEGAANGTTVGVTASSTDPNGPPVTYSLTNNAGGRFAINSSTGVVTVANGTLLNFETATSHVITVQASTGVGGASSASFTINVANVNPSTPVDVNGATNSVVENAPNGTLVGITASSTDPNGPPVVYSLTNSAGGRFAINSSTGVVTVANGSLLNFETASSHLITVQASTGVGGASSADFTINVTNINPSTPVDVNGASNLVAEGAPNGTSVGITASSTDPNGPPVVYSLTNNAGGRFAINSSTGVVTVADGTLLNFETATSHVITVQASDGAGGASSAANFTINVTNVNPSTPTDADGAANSVLEGAANGTLVGITASSTDPNGPPVVYSLTNNAGGRFAINSSTGVVTVANGTLLNFESATSHLITVQATTGIGGTSIAASFIINVANANPSVPVDTNAAANSVAEGATNGTLVGITASSTDPNGPPVVYSLTNNAGGRFAINSTTGVVTVANGGVLLEGPASYVITVQASTGIGGSSSADFTIDVANVAPTLSAAVTPSVNENGFATLTGTIIDPGTQDSFTLTLDWGDGSPGQTFTYAAGTTTISLQHQYLDDNPTGTSSDVFTITGTLTDDDGGSSNLVSSGSFFATSEGGNNLVSINPSTGVATTIGSFGFPSSFTGAFTPDGRFWTIINSSFAGQLAEVDLATGHATVVGAPPVTNDWIISLDANPAGQLFAGGHSGTYYSVDTSTGQFTPVGFGIYTCDFAFDTAGNLWAVDGSFNLHRLDPTTGARLSTIQITGLSDMTMSIAVDASNTFYVATTGSPARLYRLDPTTGATTPVGTNLGVNFIHGGDFLPNGGNLTVTVKNVAPTVNATVTPSVDENGVVTLTGTYSDVGTQDTHTLTVNWGEGSPETVAVSGGTFSLTHQYLDDNPTGTPSDKYKITGTLTDDDGGTASLGAPGPFFATSEGGNNLVSINPSTGVATTIGSFGFQSSFTGAFTPDGRFWTIVNSAFAGQLAEVDLTTGHATVVGAPPVTNDWIISLDANPAGQLFAGGHSGTYYSVDTSTGQFTPVGHGIYTCDFAFDTAGNLWAVDGSMNLHRLDPTTGARLSTIQITGLNDMTMSIAVDASNTFYVATTGFPAQLYTLDPTTGVATLVGTNLGVNYIHGGDFLPSIVPTGQQVEVTVSNVAPVVTIDPTSASAGTQGVAFTVQGSFTDVGTLDTHTFVWTAIRDGLPVDLTSVAGTSGVGTPGSTIALTYTPTEPGSYVFTLTVTDDDGGTHSASQTVNVAVGTGTVQDGGQLTIYGTSGDDDIKVVPGGGAAEIKVILNGVQQSFVGVTQIVVYANDGNDFVQISGGVTAPAVVFGGAGNDRIKAGAGNSILVGGAGDDVLLGGAGRDILIGGDGADLIGGNGEDDILVAGTTQFDSGLVALGLIRNEWTSNRSFAERVTNLLGETTTGVNGAVLLNEDTVSDDNAVDRLTGSAGHDWFVFSSSNGTNGDQVTDWSVFDALFDIDTV